MNIGDHPSFAVWAVTVVALFLKMYVNSVVQALTRVRHKHFVRADDAAFFGKGAAAHATEHPLVERMNGAWRNDLENIPMFILLALAFCIVQGGWLPLTVYCAVFVGARILHTLFYALARQPHRNLAYQAGVLMSVVCAGHVIYQLL